MEFLRPRRVFAKHLPKPERQYNNGMRHIEGSSLWLGTARDARDIPAVLNAGIEAVVDLAKLCEPVQPTRELIYLRFPLVDGAGNPPWMICAAIHAVEGLSRLGVPTLVACDGGMSRAVVVAAAALWFKTPPTHLLDTVLGRVVADGPADVHPALWADVKRFVFTVCEAFYQPPS